MDVNKIDARCKPVQGALQKCLAILTPYLPFLNAHNTDAISQSLWEKFVAENLAEEVLKLSDVELAKLPSFTLNKSHNIETEELTISCAEKSPLPPVDNAASPKENSCSNDLEQLLKRLQSCTLSELGMETTLDSLGLCTLKEDTVSVQHFMTEKKCHEVDIMADVCARLAADSQTHQIMDVGSGKGYLCSRLALMYGLQVIGVDSSRTNTNGANSRNSKLNKKWDSFVKTAKVKEKERTSKVNNSSEQTRTDGPNSLDALGSESVENISETNEAQSFPGYSQSSLESEIEVPREVNFHENVEIKLLDGIREKGYESTKSLHQSNIMNSGTSKNDPKTNGATSETSRLGSYIPLTQFIDSKTDLKNLVAENFSCGCDDNIVLTGLHTCGNLASSMLRIFVENDGIATLCNVGCCYQHLDEEFAESPFYNTVEPHAQSSNFGFPMSSLAKNLEVKLGRNARMLASQPIERIGTGSINSQKSLFWRAVLQQILIDVTGTEIKDWQIGKIFKKCPTFLVYVRKAFEKLGMKDQSQQITDDRIEEYMSKFSDQERKVFAFFQLRACFGPLVESVILLDRLLYLLEQEQVSRAHLIKLFDPVKSPRCYSIVAMKTTCSRR